MPLNKLRSRTQPARRRLGGSAGTRAGDQLHDLMRVEPFALFQPVVRIAADVGEQAGQLVLDDVAAQGFVRQAEAAEEVLVEEMAERAMADVVQQAGHPQQRFDIAPAGDVGADIAQAVVELGDGPAGQVHHPQHVLEAGVLGGGIDPPGGLQLMDLPQPLHPGMVDDLPFRDFSLGQSGIGDEGDIAMHGVMGQVFAAKVAHRWSPHPLRI